RKESLRELKFTENSPEWNERIRSLLRRYEFLGRVIGKCLYEGILVDVGFASFFLLKWALTGGLGSAQRESAYRANLNDLKDLDSGLYQGLVSKILLHLYRESARLPVVFSLASIEELPGRRGRLRPELHGHRHHPAPEFGYPGHHARVKKPRIRYSGD